MLLHFEDLFQNTMQKDNIIIIIIFGNVHKLCCETPKNGVIYLMIVIINFHLTGFLYFDNDVLLRLKMLIIEIKGKQYYSFYNYMIIVSVSVW